MNEKLKERLMKPTFQNGKLTNSSILDLSNLKREKQEMKKTERTPFTGEYNGVVTFIKPTRYFLVVTIKLQETETTYKNVSFRIYDSMRKQFENSVYVGSIIKGNCVCDCTDTYGRVYHKITSLKEIKENIVTNKLTTTILDGVLTNTFNTRDKKNKNEIAFCFKPNNSKKVDYIVADKLFENSKWFNKNSKISIEVVQEKRDIKPFENRTFRLVSMWQK